MSSSDKVETIAGNYRREWEEKKIAYLAERSMEAEEEERRKSSKVIVIEEGDDETKKMQKETRKRRLEIMRAHPFVCLTWSQMQEYNKRVNESGGFDVGDIPYNTIPEGVPVRPIDLGRHPETLVMIENLSSFAIEGFNERKKTEYQFQKVLKANLRWACRGSYRGFYYYITFQVKDIKCLGSSPLNFQAKVYYFEGDTKVIGGQQGFDVGDIPYNTIPEGIPVRPIELGRIPERLIMIENLSSFAIEGFNEREKTDYQFQKVLKANLRWACPGSYRGFYYYITFQVKDIKCPGSALVNFQAKVYYFEGDTKVSSGQQACPPITEVLSCRPEP